MAEIATNFPPQTYSSSFFLNSLNDEEKNVTGSGEGTKRSDNVPLLDCFISTMSKIIFLLMSAINWQHHTIGAVDCFLPTESKIRIFDTIEHYQGTNIPFSPIQGGWQGSNIEFSFSTIDKLPKNVFISTNSSAIISLKLSGKQIKEVDEGAFISLTCLQELFLDHNNIAKLSRNVFRDLNNLQKLDLSYNKLETLEDLIFENLSKLRSLNLRNNRIKNVEIVAFSNLTSLEILNLEQNQISQVSEQQFRSMPSLKSLVLSWNKLSNIQPEKWVGLTKLENLELAGDNLDHFDPTYNFTFSNSLKSLNLSFNSLTVLNVMALRKYLTSLELIDLNHNPWSCDDLDSILHELKDSRIRIAGRNFSAVGVNQPVCSPVRIYSTTSGPTTEGAASSTTARHVMWINKDELERYVEKKVAENNEELKSSIESIRRFTIFVFALLCVFVLVEILHRSNICGALLNRVRGGNELYVDDGNVENFRLLGR